MVGQGEFGKNLPFVRVTIKAELFFSHPSSLRVSFPLKSYQMAPKIKRDCTLEKATTVKHPMPVIEVCLPGTGYL